MFHELQRLAERRRPARGGTARPAARFPRPSEEFRQHLADDSSHGVAVLLQLRDRSEHDELPAARPGDARRRSPRRERSTCSPDRPGSPRREREDASRTNGHPAISSRNPARGDSPRGGPFRGEPGRLPPARRPEEADESRRARIRASGRPAGRVLEGVRDPEEEIRDRHLAPRRLRQRRDRQSEVRLVSPRSSSRLGDVQRAPREKALEKRPRFSAAATTPPAHREERRQCPRMKEELPGDGGAVDPTRRRRGRRRGTQGSSLLGRVGDRAEDQERHATPCRGPGPGGRLHVRGGEGGVGGADARGEGALPGGRRQRRRRDRDRCRGRAPEREGRGREGRRRGQAPSRTSSSFRVAATTCPCPEGTATSAPATPAPTRTRPGPFPKQTDGVGGPRRAVAGHAQPDEPPPRNRESSAPASLRHGRDQGDHPSRPAPPRAQASSGRSRAQPRT